MRGKEAPTGGPISLPCQSRREHGRSRRSKEEEHLVSLPGQLSDGQEVRKVIRKTEESMEMSRREGVMSGWVWVLQERRLLTRWKER